MYRIAFFSNDSNLTGAPCSLLDLLKNIDRSRYLPLVITPNDGPLVEELKKDKIEVKTVKLIGKLYNSREKSVPRFFFTLRRIFLNLWLVAHLYFLIKRLRADLIYLNSSAARYASIPSKLSKLPLVWHVREHFEGGLKKKIVTRYISFISNRIIANSKAVREMWNSKSVTSRITVVYNGISSRPIAPSRVGDVSKTLKPDAPLVGYIGQIHQVKGLDTLVEAIQLVKDDFPEMRCLIVGAAPKSQASYEKSLRELVRRKKLDNHIEFLGFRKDVFRIISNLDILVLPSNSESFGRVLIEAMVMAKPVVATNVGGIPEVVKHEETGLLVPPRNPRILAGAIRSLILDPEKAFEFGRAGQKRAEKMFSLENYHRKIQALFADLLE